MRVGKLKWKKKPSEEQIQAVEKIDKTSAPFKIVRLRFLKMKRDEWHMTYEDDVTKIRGRQDVKKAVEWLLDYHKIKPEDVTIDGCGATPNTVISLSFGDLFRPDVRPEGENSQRRRIRRAKDAAIEREKSAEADATFNRHLADTYMGKPVVPYDESAKAAEAVVNSLTE
jgi:hypothetical protein